MERLRSRAEHAVVLTQGKKLHGKHVHAFARRQSDPASAGRLGIYVGKRVRDTVVRTRIKRLIGEWMQLHDWVPTGWDMVIVAKHSMRRLQPDDFVPDPSKILSELFAPDLSKILSQLYALEAERAAA